MRRALRREHVAQGFLGAGLADGAGHGDDGRPRPGAGGEAKAAHRLQHRILPLPRHGQNRADPLELFRTRRRDHRRARALLQGGAHEVVAVPGLAADREEQVAGLQAARIDRGARDGARRAAQGAAGRRLQGGLSPERGVGHPFTSAIAARKVS